MTSWTPQQSALAHDLLGLNEAFKLREARPTFSETLGPEFVEELEIALAQEAEGYSSEEPLWMSKRHLANIFKCEGLYSAEQSMDAYTPSPATLRGRISHEATRLIASSPALSKEEAIDHAIASYSERQGKDADYLSQAPAAELAELRALSNGDVVAFFSTFPLDFPGSWFSFEHPARVKLCEGRIVLNARYDLAIGRPRDNTARRLLVDLKTGREWTQEHRADLYFYALVETLVTGVPPFRVASFYMDSARVDQVDIDEDILRSALRRTIDGVNKIASLTGDWMDASHQAGPWCKFCPVSDECTEGQELLIGVTGGSWTD